MTQPKVSIIITCYNKERYIKESIQSALNQTYTNIEVVCVNDFSSDNSKNVIADFRNSSKSDFVFLDNNKNLGVIESRNIAIEQCEGEYVLPLDGDDILDPTFIEKCMNAVFNNHYRWVYARTRLIDEFSTPLNEWPLPKFDLDSFIFNNCIPCTAIFSKSDFFEVGMYKSYMRDGCEDYDLWLSFVEKGLIPFCIDEVLFNYRLLEKDSRNILAKEKYAYWTRELFKHHYNLYEKSSIAVDRLFTDYKSLYERENIRFNIMKKKKEKYMILFFISLFLFLFFFTAFK